MGAITIMTNVIAVAQSGTLLCRRMAFGDARKRPRWSTRFDS